jgi:leader peptidase (prepilin peptidase)/N-methyltransferase
LLLVPIALIDIEHRIIPNRLTALGALLALAIGIALDPSGEPERLVAAIAAGGALLLAALAYPGGMGMGDVKLAGVMGLFLGSAVAPAMLAALFAGLLFGALVAASKGTQAARKTAIPFGPFLAAGSLVAVFAGDSLVNWYSTHFLT